METTSADAAIRSKYHLIDAWGLHSAIDIHGCNPDTIRSADKIKQFVVELCDLIETSLISAHFANQTNAVYLDVFSCKYYDPNVVAEFAKKFFGGQDYDLNYICRK